MSGAGSAPFASIAAGSHQEGSDAMSARNLGPAEVKAIYAAVVSGSPSSLQVGRSSPLPMDQPRLILLLYPKQTLGACPYATCPGLSVACMLAPLTPFPNQITLTPLPQVSAAIQRPFISRGFPIPVAFWHGRGRAALKASQLRRRASGSWCCQGRQTISGPPLQPCDAWT
jgi:hypothetical protein